MLFIIVFVFVIGCTRLLFLGYTSCGRHLMKFAPTNTVGSAAGYFPVAEEHGGGHTEVKCMQLSELMILGLFVAANFSQCHGGQLGQFDMWVELRTPALLRHFKSSRLRSSWSCGQTEMVLWLG